MIDRTPSDLSFLRRRTSGLSALDLSVAVGIPVWRLRRIEYLRCRPTEAEVRLIAAALAVSVDDVAELTKPPKET